MEQNQLVDWTLKNRATQPQRLLSPSLEQSHPGALSQAASRTNHQRLKTQVHCDTIHTPIYLNKKKKLLDRGVDTLL